MSDEVIRLPLLNSLLSAEIGYIVLMSRYEGEEDPNDDIYTRMAKLFPMVEISIPNRLLSASDTGFFPSVGWHLFPTIVDAVVLYTGIRASTSLEFKQNLNDAVSAYTSRTRS